MPFIILFIYLSYMLKTGHLLSPFDWIILFVVGVIQILVWSINAGSQAIRIKEYEQVARLKKYFKEQEYESDNDS
tara:strand:+ start:425 stop:649 length:225 start_codon:yes stop_codon:yes gene_type:complete